MEGLPTKKELLNWEFDWSQEAKKGYTVMRLYARGDSRLQGLISTKIRKDIHAIEINLVEAAPMNNPHNKMFVRKEYEGIGGHLFAEAIRQSYIAGFDGFVMFVAKTDLIKYYEDTLEAKVANFKERTIYIDERSAKKYMYNILKNDDENVLDIIGLPPINYDGPEYNIRALDKYCREKGMKPEDLSENDLIQFELKRKENNQ